MATHYCMLFELKSIQTFLYSSGRLRDVIGASELVDLLTNEADPRCLLDAVLAAVGQPGSGGISFSRRAGGAIYAFSDDLNTLRRCGDLVALGIQQVAPTLSYVMGWGHGENHPSAFRLAREDVLRQGSLPIPALPTATPMAERATRTGHAAVAHHRKDGAIDAPTAAKKPFADLRNAGFLDRFSPSEAKLSGEDWPRDLNPDDSDDAQGASQHAFPFAGSSDLALIRADGNGMGQILRRLAITAQSKPDQYIKIYQAFSTAIEVSTQAGAKRATRNVLLPKRETGRTLAARPILLGGDDVTVLVRADLAIAYVREFAQGFEEESRQQLQRLAHLGVTELPEQLTLGFGVAFIGASQPFRTAIEQAEALMQRAKQDAKRLDRPTQGGRVIAPSTLVFHRNTAALIVDYDDLLEQTLSHRHGEATYTHTLGTYTVREKIESLPCLDDLESLCTDLRNPAIGRGALRGLLTILQLDRAQATLTWKRWRELMAQHQALLEHIDRTLTALMPTYDKKTASLPYALHSESSGRQQWLSPLGDALALLAVNTDLAANTSTTSPHAEASA